MGAGIVVEDRGSESWALNNLQHRAKRETTDSRVRESDVVVDVDGESVSLSVSVSVSVSVRMGVRVGARARVRA